LAKRSGDRAARGNPTALKIQDFGQSVKVGVVVENADSGVLGARRDQYVGELDRAMA
jgi:hypothetical protein